MRTCAYGVLEAHRKCQVYKGKRLTVTGHNLFYYSHESFANVQPPLEGAMALWFDKLVIRDPVGASWDMMTALALNEEWAAFATASGLPNPLYPEQSLALELGRRVESQQQIRPITLVRMEDLFRPILHRETIDETWPPERQNTAFFEADASYVAITRRGEYLRMVSRLSILNSMVEKLVVPNKETL